MIPRNNVATNLEVERASDVKNDMNEDEITFDFD